MTSGSHLTNIECEVMEVREQRKTGWEGDRGIIHSGTDGEGWKQDNKEREVSRVGHHHLTTMFHFLFYSFCRLWNNFSSKKNHTNKFTIGLFSQT